MRISHGASSQRGSVVLYLLCSIIVATAVGYGVYVVMRDHKPAAGADEVSQAGAPRPTRAQAPVVAVPVEDPAEPPSAVDTAERDAIAPADIPDPAKDTVLLGTPGVAGGLDVDSVERTIKRYLVRYDRCMRRSTEHHRLQRGELRVTLVIADNGNVDYATGKPTNVEDELASCVVDVIKKLKFDRASDGGKVKVVYPIAFVPATRGDADPATDDPLGNLR